MLGVMEHAASIVDNEDNPRGSVVRIMITIMIMIYNYGYENNGMMILPPMALITVGILIWLQRTKNTKLIEPK